MYNIKNYYLLLDKIIDLPSPKRNMIMDMYRDMVNRIGDKSSEGMVESYFNTLEMNGFIQNRQTFERTKKINDLTNE